MKRKGILILMAITLVMSACKKKGCTDPTANNYNASAEKDDGSCTFDPETGVSSATTLDCQLFNNTGTTYDLVDLGLEIDYIVDCKMPVSCDLKIMPGVTIAFTSDAGLKVNSNGSINAVATATGPILFTGVDALTGSWAGLYIDSEDVKNKISGCKVEYAGGDAFNSNGDEGGIILYASCKAEITNTTIENCDAYGINANYGGGDFIFSNNTISNCTKPMFIAGEYAGSISGGTFTGNSADVIYIDTYAGDGLVLTSQTWTDLAVPYRVKGGGTIGPKCDWVIAPGVIIEMEPSSTINVATGYSMKAVGTASNLIKIRGTVAGQGAWKNIKFNTTNVLNEIGFAEITGGGEDAASTLGTINLWYDAKLNIHDVHFIDNAACGVYGVLSGGQSSNPNYSSSNLTYTNTPCTESFN